MSEKKLIITADDYGMSLGVNRAIDAGIVAGLITSTNVMTNMKYYREAAKLRETNVSVGLHWTVSAGKPVCDKSEIPSLVSEDGTFFSYPEFRKRYRNRQIKDEDIKKELIAQYKRFVEVCGEPDYWNTHQNTHVDFGVFKLFVDTAKELKIFKMRSHKRVYIPSSDNVSTQSLVWKIVEPIKRIILNSWMKYANKQGMKSPYGIMIALNKNDLNNLDYCFRNAKTVDDTFSEYVIHPSAALDSEYFGSIGEHRITEYRQFTDENTGKITVKNGFNMSTFAEL